MGSTVTSNVVDTKTVKLQHLYTLQSHIYARHMDSVSYVFVSCHVKVFNTIQVMQQLTVVFQFRDFETRSKCVDFLYSEVIMLS